MNKILEKEAKNTFKKILKKIEKEKRKKIKIKSNKYLYKKIEYIINKTIEEIFNKKYEIEIDLPPQHLKNYHLTFNIFKIAKENNKKPEEIAEIIKNNLEKIKNPIFKKIDYIQGFINIELNFKNLAFPIIFQVKELKNKFGKNDDFKNKICLIDYSSPNIAKPIGVGHLRSTIIGQALANIYEANGFIVIKLNHLGDWGTQFGQLITAYLKWGNLKKINKNPIYELKNLYVKFHKEKEKNNSLEVEAKNNFQKLEKGNLKFLKIWEKFRKLSIEEFKKTYKKLKIEFDSYIGESYYAPLSKKILNLCLKKDIAFREKDNSVIAQINNLPTFILQKSDGSTVYLLRDLAALKDRILKFNPKIILYVVGHEQELHFKQLFKLAELLNFSKKTELKHISFGLVLKEGKKMSTRADRFISLDLLIEKTIKKAEEILKKRRQQLKEEGIKKISKIIGIGAIIYNDLKQSREKNIDFNWQKMLNFKEGTSIYLQYSAVRINSILKKIENKKIENKKIEIENLNEIEEKILNKIIFYPKIVKKAQQKNHPHIIAEYLEDLAKLFNNFYNQFSIINTKDKKLFVFRILLIQAIKQIIENGLRLLNIEIPEKM